MILAIAFCERDQDLMLKNIGWWNELGGCPGHKAVIWRDKRTKRELSDQIQAEFTKCFDDVTFHSAGAEIDGWPEGANYFMRIASGYLQNKPERYFFWMEPDAIPLKESWMDFLENEYLKEGRPFMGDRVEVNDVPLHMSGVGIYWNPLYEKAGEAYRAHDVAWDIAAKDQIVPNCHFTELIEHAWKHPEFKTLQEVAEQISPKTILFHSSKDGSLIDLLRQKRGGTSNVAIHDEKEPAAHVSVSSPSPLSSFPHPDALHAATHSGPVDAGIFFRREKIDKIYADKPPYSIGDMTGQPVYDIFIRTYPLDYPWLQFCLRSIQQYARVFRKIWIISPDEPVGFPNLGKISGIPGYAGTAAIEWKVMNEESEDGYLSQQIHKLYADVITNYEADYILHIDSDTLFTRAVTPQHFFKDEYGKLIWYYTPYEHTETPWKPITEKFMKVEVKNEFMRRLPMMVPRWLYDVVRKNCLSNHGVSITDYIKQQPYREFSEFNILGAVAWIHYHDKFEWIDTLAGDMPEPFARQFFSWGGLTEEVKTEIQNILSGGSNVPEAITNDNPVSQGPSSPLPAQTSAPEPKSIVGAVPTSDGQSSREEIGISPGAASPGDHIRWLERYIEGSPSRRQYVMNQLKKARLVPLRQTKK